MLIIVLHRDYNDRYVAYICTACMQSALYGIELILEQVPNLNILGNVTNRTQNNPFGFGEADLYSSGIL
jgi:hypothetical protein